MRLSDATYNSNSVAAIGVAAHECGHAIQHETGYVPLAVRGSLVPIANFGSSIAWPLILIGLFMNSGMSALLLNLGILLYEDEVRDTKKVLKAAALTYVAGAASAILQLLRIVLLANRRND